MIFLRTNKILIFTIFLSTIPIASLAGGNVIKARILYAEKISFLREPDSYTYIKKAISKDDLNGNAHVPFSKAVGFLRLFNPLNWRDGEITIDSYDVLLEHVRIVDGKNGVRNLDSLLIRHVTYHSPNWENQAAYDDYPNIKRYAVDLPDRDRDNTRIELWYSDDPISLVEFTERQQDRSRNVLIGHIHLYRSSDNHTQRIWSNYGRYGILFGTNFRKKNLKYETNICSNNDH